MQGPMLTADIELAKASYDLNFWGVIRVTQAFGPIIIETVKKEGGPGVGVGRIINLGSIVGLRTLPWRGIYGSSKTAVHALSDALRLEVKGFGIDVIVLVPGLIHTNIMDNTPVVDDTEILPLYPKWKEIQRTMDTVVNGPYTTARDWAVDAVRVLTKKRNVPAYYFSGVNAKMFQFIAYRVPTSWADWFIGSKLGTNLVGRE